MSSTRGIFGTHSRSKLDMGQDDIPPPVDPGKSIRNHEGVQGRLFKVPIELSLREDPDLISESNAIDIFVPDTDNIDIFVPDTDNIDIFVPDIDNICEPREIDHYNLKGWKINRQTMTKDPVIVTCNLTFWPPTRPGIKIEPVSGFGTDTIQ